MKRWKQSLKKEELKETVKTQRSNLLGMSTLKPLPDVIQQADYGIRITDVKSIAPTINTKSSETNATEMPDLGIKIVETKSIAAVPKTRPYVMKSNILSAQSKLLKTAKKASTSGGKLREIIPKPQIRIMDPSSINNSVSDKSIPSKAMDMSKHDGSSSKATLPFTMVTHLGNGKRIVFPQKILMKRSELQEKLTTAPTEQILPDKSQCGDLEMNSSRAVLDPTEFVDCEEDIKPDHSQLLVVKQEPGVPVLISNGKRRRQVAEDKPDNLMPLQSKKLKVSKNANNN